MELGAYVIHIPMRRSAVTVLLMLALSACEGQGEAVSQPREQPVEAPAAAPRPVEPTPAAIADPKLIEPPPNIPEEPSPELKEDEQTYVEPEPPPVPEPPEDYGRINPPDPLPGEASLVNHALVGYEVVAVYAKPDKKSPRLGYMRIGTRLKVTDKVEGKGCSGGWYSIPQGGYACAGKGGGLVVDAKRKPYMHREPPPPRMDQGFPYDYALVRKWNSPMYWRVPTQAEQVIADERRAELEAKRTGEPVPGTKPAETKPAETKPAETKPAEPGKKLEDKPATKSGDLKALPKPPGADKDAKPKADESPEQKPSPDKPVVAKTDAKPESKPEAPAEAKPDEPEPEPIKLPLNPATPWLEKGFYISLADKIEENGKTWWRTARGGYVSAKAAVKYTPKDYYEGTVLSEEADFPFGYAMAKSPKLLELTDDGKLIVKETIERRTFLDLSEETVVNGRAYMVTTEGLLIRKDHVRFAERQPLPEGLQPWERWVDVDITKQLLVAYEGERPVFTTLVSTGRKGTKEEPFDTPTGRWRIRSKHVSTTMDGPTATDGNYSIQDVPWTMYFYDSYALHGAFWHDGFGRVRSHGCVNLSPEDAHWLFDWTTPFLPEGWHGVQAHDGSPGTTVVVRKSVKKK